MSVLPSIDPSLESHPLCIDLVPPERVSPKLRDVLRARGAPDDPEAEPRSFSAQQLKTLRAIVARILPDAATYRIDLALRLDEMMAEQEGNGWRYEALPTDPEAYRIGLETLEHLARSETEEGFADLPGAEQDRLLEGLDSGAFQLPERHERFTAEQMKLWFEEVRSDAVRHYVAHPAIMARIGYSGFANGGTTGASFQGFQKVGMDERESWEPEPTDASYRTELTR